MLCDDIVNDKQSAKLLPHFAELQRIFDEEGCHKFLVSSDFSNAINDIFMDKSRVEKLFKFSNPPYRSMWIETSTSMFTDAMMELAEPGEDTDSPRTLRTGMLIAPCDWEGKVGWRGNLFAKLDRDFCIRRDDEDYTISSRILLSPAFSWAEMPNKDGLFYFGCSNEVYDAYFGGDKKQAVRLYTEGHIKVFILALGLMNTRNVAERERIDTSGSAKARRKRGLTPLYDYHVIKLSDRLKRSFTNKYGEIEHGMMRQHFVRGHFKERKSGLYWWSPFLRGNPERGFVDKDYEVA